MDTYRLFILKASVSFAVFQASAAWTKAILGELSIFFIFFSPVLIGIIWYIAYSLLEAETSLNEKILKREKIKSFRKHGVRVLFLVDSFLGKETDLLKKVKRNGATLLKKDGIYYIAFKKKPDELVEDSQKIITTLKSCGVVCSFKDINLTKPIKLR